MSLWITLCRPFSLVGTEKKPFSRLFRRFLHRGDPPFPTFFAEFSTMRGKSIFFFILSCFFVHRIFRTKTFHRLFHTLWKSFVALSDACHSPSENNRTSNDISATKGRHLTVFTSSYRQILVADGLFLSISPENPPQMPLKRSLRRSFPQVVGIPVEKSKGVIFKSLDRQGFFQNSPFFAFGKGIRCPDSRRTWRSLR